MKRFLILAIVVLALLVAGCTGSDEATQEVYQPDIQAEGDNEVINGDTSTRVVEVANEVQVRWDYSIYHERHNRMKELLEDHVDERAKIYTYNMQINGDILAVEEHFVKIDDDVVGIAYVEIDSINTAIFPEDVE